MTCAALFSFALCANHSFSSSTCFRCAGAIFWQAACSRCRASGTCNPGAWQARDSVSAFVGPVVQSTRFGGPETCQNWSKSFWRHSPALVLDACRKRVKVGFRGRSSTLDDFEFVASLLCVTGAVLSWLNFVAGAALWSFCANFVAGALLWHLGRFRGRHVTFTQRDRSRCGALCALWVGRIVFSGAARILSGKRVTLTQRDRGRCTFEEREANPLRTLGGSNRARCGAVHFLRTRSEPSAHFGSVRILSTRREASAHIGRVE